jgi:FkbM family methyltransferase
MSLVRHLVRPGDVFIDVGANIGVYTLIACMSTDVRVWAFEPSSETMERLRENVQLNALDNRVILEQKAVGAAVGPGRLTRGLDSVNHLMTSGDIGPTEEVEVTTIDSVVPRPPSSALTIMKIDVEGAELGVLEGAADLLSDASPVIIAERNDPAAVTGYLAQTGYRPYDYDPLTRTLHELPVVSDSQQNMVFIADIEKVRSRLEDNVVQPGHSDST